MNISTDTSSIFPNTMGSAQNARKLIRNVNGQELTLTPEQTEEEKKLETSTVSIQRELTPEEEKRVQFLKDMLAQLLTLADGQPSDEQKARIKEIEKELEKITGIKTRSHISKVTENMIGKKDEKEEEEQARQLKGTDPKDAVHSKMPDQSSGPMAPAIKMLQQQAFHTQLQTMIDNSGGLASISKLK